MEICEGLSLSGLQELAKQQHLNAAEKKRKQIDPEEDLPGGSLTDEAQVEHSEALTRPGRTSLAQAQQVLAKLPTTRSRKLETVQRRIGEGFYQQQEVLEAVAERLLRLLRFQEQEG